MPSPNQTMFVMTEKEKSYYETLKNNPKDYVFGKLFVVENGIIKPIEGKWFKLMGDGIPFIYYTDLTREQNEAGVPEPLHPLELIMSFTSERTITATPVLGDSIFTFEREAGIDSKLGNWIKKNEEIEKIEKKEREERKNRLEDNQINTPKGYKDYEEDYFIGWRSMKRYYQALHYGRNDSDESAYGMECNGTAIMYFLQDLGLIYPQMTRKQFEHLFITKAYPYPSINTKNKSISIDNNLVFPITKPNVLFPNTINEDALLGKLKLGELTGISLVNQSLTSAIKKFNSILQNFASLPEQKSYDFFKNYHNTVAGNIIDKSSIIVDITSKLATADFEESHFDDGKSIFVSVDIGYYDTKRENAKDYNGTTSHYALIQGMPVADFIYKNKSYYIYPADDSLFGKVLVIAPAFVGDCKEIKVDGIGYQSFSYSGTTMHLHSVTNLQLGIL